MSPRLKDKQHDRPGANRPPGERRRLDLPAAGRPVARRGVPGCGDGKPHRKYVTRRTRALVAAEIGRLLEAQRQGQVITTGGMTVGERGATYLGEVAQPEG